MVDRTQLLGLNFDMTPISNVSFEDWSGGLPVSWTLSAGTVTEESTEHKVGSKCAKLAGSGVQAYLYQSLANPETYDGLRLHIRCWIKASDANAARLRITSEVGTSYSSYHSGDGEWQLLEVSQDMVASVVANIYVGITCEIGFSAYYDLVMVSRWDFDSGFYFDEEEGRIVTAVETLSVYEDVMAMREAPQGVIRYLDEALVNYTKFVDLLPLVPEKFRTSSILQAYLQTAGINVGQWLSKVDDLVYILNPDRVGVTYAQYLADAIGLQLVRDDDTTLASLRRQIRWAIAWYKLKGTYQAMITAAYLLGLEVQISDMYTNDYVTFVLEDWYAGDEGTNPPGLDSSYYKSSHFGIEYVLNQVFQEGSDEYLWRSVLYTPLTEYVETIRPANTVPHYILSLTPETDESGAAMAVDGDIVTAVQASWVPGRYYFDEGTWKLDNTEGGGGQIYLNQTQDTYYNSITEWALGTGNKGASPDDSGFVIETPVLTGTIDVVRILTDRVEYEILVPATAQVGLSELGLYIPGVPDDLVIGSTFPDIDLVAGVELRITVKVYQVT